jgi:hypothetical protein
MNPVICECGCTLLHAKNLTRHLNTKKHKQNMYNKYTEKQNKKINLKDVAASTLQAYLRAKIDANDLQPAIFSDLFEPSVYSSCNQ